MPLFFNLSAPFSRKNRARARRSPRRLRPRFALAYEQLEDRHLLAFVTELVRDINTDGASSTYEGGAELGDSFIFASNNALWKTDGTEAGTVRLADVHIETTTPLPQRFVRSGNFVYFTALVLLSAPQYELWRTDGTPQGTHVVRDFEPRLSWKPPQLADSNGILFFNAYRSPTGFELWKTDGTSEGTTLVKPLLTTPLGRELTAVNGTVLFTAWTNNLGAELWKTDGTPEGTMLVAEVNAGPSDSHPTMFTPVGDSIYFLAPGGLWKSDGTPEGTRRITQPYPAGPFGPIEFIVDRNGSVIFGARDFSSTTALWMVDDATGDTTRFASFRTSPPSYNLRNFQVVGSTLYFSVPYVEQELWKTDGTAAGTQLVYDAPGWANPDSVVVYNDLLYFSMRSAANGQELWQSNGTAIGTRQIKEFAPGVFDGSPQLTSAIGKLFISAITREHGRELFVSDGTSEGTHLIKDLTPGTADAFTSHTDSAVATDDRVYFTATNPDFGRKIWRTDGTTSETSVIDQGDGQATIDPNNIARIGNTVYFTAGVPSLNGTSLFRTDGTPEGTALVYTPTSARGGRSPGSLFPVGNRLYFVATAPSSNDDELWMTDGTDLGTVLLKDLRPGPGTSQPQSFTAVGDRLFFKATVDGIGTELWTSDGTTDGTQLVKDIRTGSASSSVDDMIEFNGLLFFSALGDSGHHLWKSDGTESGTVPLASTLSVNSLCRVNGIVYFTSSGEIWRTDGSEAGTHAVAPNDDYRTVYDLVNFNGVLYFTCSGRSGFELWKSDGTTDGTVFVKALPGQKDLRELKVAGRYLYIRHSSPTLANSLFWRSDGTSEGTVILDVPGGTPAAAPFFKAELKGQLYFEATTPQYGRELWRTGALANTPSITLGMTMKGQQSTSGLKVTHNPLDGAEVPFLKVTDITGGLLFLNDGATRVIAGDFVPLQQAALGFKFSPAPGFTGHATFKIQASTTDSDLGLGGDVVVADVFVIPTFNILPDTLYLVANDEQTEVEVYDVDPFQFAVPPLISWPIDLPDPLPLNTLGGDDQIIVQLPAGMNGPAGGIRFDTGAGTNLLTVRGGNVLIDSTSTGGSLITIVAAGAHLTTLRLDQFRLALQGTGTKVTLLPDGGASVLDDLELSLGTTLDVTNNSLILHSTEANKEGRYIDLRTKIQSAQNGVDPNFITSWSGNGLTSSTARAANVAAGFDLVNLGLIRNSDLDIVTGLPGSAYTIFAGVPVGPHDLLLKYTYTGDGNLDGAVTFDDYAAMDAAFFGLVPTLGWANGDINADSAINFDDYAVVDQAFFQQSAPLAGGGLGATAGRSGLAVASLSGSAAVGQAMPAEVAPAVPAAVGWGEAQRSPTNDALRIVAIPSPTAPSDPEGDVVSDLALQSANSLADSRLSTSRRAPSRDLWDSALLDVLI